MLLDHITFAVSDYARSKAFYEKALAPLGIEVMMEFGASCGFGDTRPFFWIAGGGAVKGRLHIAFVAKDHGAVDAFHKAAMAAGAKDNGAPGIRAQYHPSYYGAFVLDPDGHNIEAVNHGG
jgi:catechol 2,3-dioxygenase-like lactoylglutathione lyase family enzyme